MTKQIEINRQKLETKQTLPCRETFTGKLGDNFATFFPITERISGDTVFNERRSLIGVEIHISIGNGNYHVLRVLEKPLARKLFDLNEGWPLGSFDRKTGERLA